MSNELSTISSAKDLIFNPSAMGQMMKLAEIMASSVCTVPKHLQGNVGDCFAIAMQSAQWGLSPYACAQKTHIVNGTLGYEAQLINSVINTMAPIKGRLKFEWRGDWDKYINGGMQKAHEVGLCVIVSGTLQGEEAPTENSTYLAPQTIRNSPLWKTDPKQQLAYLGIKKWARLHCPDVIMGVYSPDELEYGTPLERELNPIPPTHEPEQTLQGVLTQISASTTDDFSWIDAKKFNSDEKMQIRGATATRRKELKEASVVSTQPASMADGTDWADLVKNSTSNEELTAIYNSMPADIKTKLNDAVDEKMDSFRVVEG